jgi:hypothetical protein
MLHTLLIFEQYNQVAQCAELALQCWPAACAAQGSAGASNSSSSSSSSSGVTAVTVADALPVALAAASMLPDCIAARQHYQNMTPQQYWEQVVELGLVGSHREFLQLQQGGSWRLTSRPVLALQLLLLACQAKLHWQGCAADASMPQPELAPGSSRLLGCTQQQQQQGQLLQQHDLLLAAYKCQAADLSAIEQHHHVRWAPKAACCQL